MVSLVGPKADVETSVLNLDPLLLPAPELGMLDRLEGGRISGADRRRTFGCGFGMKDVKSGLSMVSERKRGRGIP